MKVSKLLLSALLLVAMSGFAHSYDLQYPDLTMQYDESRSVGDYSKDLQFICVEDSGDPCPYDTSSSLSVAVTLKVTGCNGSLKMVPYDGPNIGENYLKVAAGAPTNGFHPPQGIHCGLVDNAEWKVSTGYASGFTEENKAGSVTINANDMPNNKGRYLMAEFQAEAGWKLNNFFLTNDPYYDDDGDGCVIPGDPTCFNELPDKDSGRPQPKHALLFINDADRGIAPDKDDNAVFYPEYGARLDGDGDSGVKPSVGQMDMRNWTGSDNDWWTLAGTEIQDPHSVSYRYFSLPDSKKFHGKCSTAVPSGAGEHHESCSPLHTGGEYDPDGEIIVATEPSRSSLFSPTAPFTEHEETYFFVCRGNYMGNDISSSKMVKVQEYVGSGLSNIFDIDYYEWQWHRCDMNKNWIEVNCDPGMQIEQLVSGNYDCVEKDPVQVKADYFNIQDLKSTTATGGFITGFKIDRSEIEKFTDVMGRPPKTIDAECWLGNNDQRPGSSKRMQVEYDYNPSESRDVWVLGEMPWRTGVNNYTYSCLYGMANQDSSKPNIWEGTRNPPLTSFDEERINRDYSFLKNKYEDLIMDGTLDPFPSGGTFSGYWGTQRNRYITQWDEHPFRDNFSTYETFPYCDGTLRPPQEPPTWPDADIICG